MVNSGGEAELVNPIMIRAYNGEHKGATAFFRNRPLIGTLFALMQQINKKRVKILVHACSVGAEPYSLALWWLHNAMPGGGKIEEIEIAATDIDPGFLAFAQQAKYPEALLAGMSPLEQSWFDRAEGGISVPTEARSLVRFLEPMSFVDGDPGEDFDVVVIMNALTYVTARDQSAALMRCAGYTGELLSLTAFHPDSIRDDLVRAGFAPCLENHRQIHEAWGDRLAIGPIPPDHPDYSWRLPPYGTDVADWPYRFGALFRREP